jgi:predicted DNA-binding transcriptional regulator AlpA
MTSRVKTLAEINEVPNEGLLRIDQLLKMIPIGKSTIWVRVKEKKFPQPIMLSSKTAVWKKSDILAYINSYCEKNNNDGSSDGSSND